MKEDIVIPAWEIASKNSEIKFFNFLPSFIATLYLALIILYQLAWSYINVFDLEDAFFQLIIDFIHSDSFWTILTIGFGMFILYILAIPIAQGGLIAMIDKLSQHHDGVSNTSHLHSEKLHHHDSGDLPSEENHDTKNHDSGHTHENISEHSVLTSKNIGEVIEKKYYTGYALASGLRHFLPIFEANNITALFKLISIITFTLFLIRLLGSQYIPQIVSGMTVYFLLAVVLNIFLAYTRFFIVLEGKKAFDAVVASASMALSNMGITFKLYITLILVYIRTILTVAIFIVIPFVFSAVITYITTAGLRFVFFVFLGGFVFIFFVFTSHLNSVLEIFVETLWYRAYKDNKTRDVVGHHDSHSDSHHDSHGHDSHGHDDHHGHH